MPQLQRKVTAAMQTSVERSSNQKLGAQRVAPRDADSVARPLR
ncbi:MAG: hypothetical protein U1F26_14280 [Lysobacterales bacterium]